MSDGATPDRICFSRQDGHLAPVPRDDPKPFKGSVHHYFHFLLGYLLPVVHRASARSAPFDVIDCGPVMTPMLTRTLDAMGRDYRVVPPDAATNMRFVQMWDQAPDRRLMTPAIRTMREIWDTAPCHGTGCDTGETLILRRSPPPAFYASGQAHGEGYGTTRRAILNIDAISDHLSRLGDDHSIYEPGQHALGCQMRAFRRARRVFGIRGAEWANAVWCDPGTLRARVLFPGRNNHTIERVMTAFARDFTLWMTDDTHPEISPGLVRRLLYQPGTGPTPAA
ncbi:glycosyltransferase 61 family protein [Pseudaestuariivita atlantica]|uniref:Glycosyltransferase 61 catalytic domain-containing protein n=1 Tax=Pseudaestuariivita atlantica TaxID=1317121 RepID=A0A0L1JSN7_9RHOB|nr:glycosyltransferase 61 family protein [Pseudaestuariivita atlantica]KNG94770.1 hypothetical protein ATO11_05100 [Pseudaestuariivita atlantica]